MTRDKSPGFCNANALFKDRNSLVRSAGKGECIAKMKCDEGEANRAVGKGSGRQRSLERAQRPSQVSLTQRYNPETEMGVAATEGVIGIFSDAKGIFGDIERFGKSAGFGKAPRNKTARKS